MDYEKAIGRKRKFKRCGSCLTLKRSGLEAVCMLKTEQSYRLTGAAHGWMDEMG